jgi:hypothetical protein
MGRSCWFYRTIKRKTTKKKYTSFYKAFNGKYGVLKEELRTR